MTSKLLRYGNVGRTFTETEWILNTDVSTSSATGITVANLWTPEANSTYTLEGKVWLKSAATTTGVQIGLGGTMNSGSTASSVRIITMATTATDATALTTLGSFQAAGTATLAYAQGSVDALIYNASGTAQTPISLMMRSEISGSTVSMAAGSWMRWRRIN